jgi:hypothetical protein
MCAGDAGAMRTTEYARRQSWTKGVDKTMIGELTDKGLSVEGYWVARIDDVPYPCLPTTITFLERLEKGWQVEYHLTKESKISLIKRAPKTAAPAEGGFTTADKLKKAGFDQPAKQPAKEVMSAAEVEALKAKADAAAKAKAQEPDKPLEAGIKLVQGQITALDAGTHTITVKDKTGTHHEMMWKAAMNDKMAKLKQWFFVAISAEKFGEYWIVIDQTYFAKPTDWPVSQKQGRYGGKQFTPRNEKIIVLQSTLKVCAEVWTHTHMKINDLDFDTGMDEIIARAIKDTETLMKVGGA